MNAAFSYLSEIGAKNESDILKKKVKILQIVVGVKAIQRCLIVFSLLWTLLREKKEKNGEGE